MSGASVRVTGRQTELWDYHPMARRYDAESSHEAADELDAKGLAQAQRRQAVDLVCRWQGMTTRQLAALACGRSAKPQELERVYYMLARRLPEAWDESQVHGRVLKTESGRKRTLWFYGKDPTGRSRQEQREHERGTPR